MFKEVQPKPKVRQPIPTFDVKIVAGRRVVIYPDGSIRGDTKTGLPPPNVRKTPPPELLTSPAIQEEPVAVQDKGGGYPVLPPIGSADSKKSRQGSAEEAKSEDNKSEKTAPAPAPAPTAPKITGPVGTLKEVQDFFQKVSVKQLHGLLQQFRIKDIERDGALTTEDTSKIIQQKMNVPMPESVRNALPNYFKAGKSSEMVNYNKMVQFLVTDRVKSQAPTTEKRYVAAKLPSTLNPKEENALVRDLSQVLPPAKNFDLSKVSQGVYEFDRDRNDHLSKQQAEYALEKQNLNIPGELMDRLLRGAQKNPYLVDIPKLLDFFERARPGAAAGTSIFGGRSTNGIPEKYQQKHQRTLEKLRNQDNASSGDPPASNPLDPAGEGGVNASFFANGSDKKFRKPKEIRMPGASEGEAKEDKSSADSGFRDGGINASFFERGAERKVRPTKQPKQYQDPKQQQIEAYENMGFDSAKYRTGKAPTQARAQREYQDPKQQQIEAYENMGFDSAKYRTGKVPTQARAQREYQDPKQQQIEAYENAATLAPPAAAPAEQPTNVPTDYNEYAYADNVAYDEYAYQDEDYGVAGYQPNPEDWTQDFSIMTQALYRASEDEIPGYLSPEELVHVIGNYNLVYGLNIPQEYVAQAANDNYEPNSQMIYIENFAQQLQSMCLGG
ncbi:unnamed protein product [Cyprideis torosa]|uniref:Uncharacterized protein n=1 Tax=Cyprideis torosa TaxID=163714 RepID=A0A7R8WFG1_9CRUS|nr:unnamed protein product [Cyprideis torosa]CAG0896938.1 unnamed protein product [Cyprideis torosa]